MTLSETSRANYQVPRVADPFSNGPDSDLASLNLKLNVQLDAASVKALLVRAGGLEDSTGVDCSPVRGGMGTLHEVYEHRYGFTCLGESAASTGFFLALRPLRALDFKEICELLVQLCRLPHKCGECV